MTLPKIITTTSFRLSALYICIFLASFLAIGLIVYFLTCKTLEKQLKHNIEIEVLELKAAYDQKNIAELLKELGEREKITTHYSHEYMHHYGLLNPDGSFLSGTLQNIKPVEGWQTITAVSQDPLEDEQILYIKVIQLQSGYWLAVGDDGEFIQDAGEAIIRAFLWGGLLVIILGSAGGLYLSHRFLYKIKLLTKSTQAIIAGDLNHRLSVSKGNDEIDRLALLFNQMLDKISTLIQNIQEISNDIAHDLRTPISRLKNGLQQALQNPLTATQYQEHMIAATKEVDIILATFSAILRISQIESGSRRQGFKLLNFSALVSSIVETIQPVVEENGKSLISDITDGIPLVADKELLTQLIYNLIENAILHTPLKTVIQVRLELQDNYPILVISDNGLGIPPKYREKVFQRFYRLEHSRSMPGNGLGLSIVKAIVDLHEAYIELSDNAPGLKVAVVFPKMQAADS